MLAAVDEALAILLSPSLNQIRRFITLSLTTAPVRRPT
jgi:hypothetical protein